MISLLGVSHLILAATICMKMNRTEILVASLTRHLTNFTRGSVLSGVAQFRFVFLMFVLRRCCMRIHLRWCLRVKCTSLINILLYFDSSSTHDVWDDLGCCSSILATCDLRLSLASALSDSLNRCNYIFILLTRWSNFILFWLGSVLRFADFQLQNSFIWTIPGTIRTSSETPVGLITTIIDWITRCLRLGTLRWIYAAIYWAMGNILISYW